MSVVNDPRLDAPQFEESRWVHRDPEDDDGAGGSGGLMVLSARSLNTEDDASRLIGSSTRREGLEMGDDELAQQDDNLVLWPRPFVVEKQPWCRRHRTVLVVITISTLVVVALVVGLVLGLTRRGVGDGVVSGVNNSFSYYYSFLTTTTTPVAGYAQGSELWVVNASNSSLAISVYVPPMLCAIENCPFGTCDQSSNTCTSGASFPSDIGLGTVARAYSTYYCNLSPSSDQCDGPPGSGPLSAYSAASGVANALAYPVCAMTDEGYDYRVPCVGVAAVPARMLGNLQLDRDPYNNSVANWQLGMSAASGVCHELIGSTGKHAIVVTVARCDGVCSCGGGCNTTCSLASNCLSSASMRPSCSCVGGGGAPGQCCGFNSVHNNDSCATANPVSDCDWCAAGTHPHFAVDFATYYILCSDSELGGGCRLQSVRPFICMQPLAGTIWPFKSQAAAVCGASSFLCSVSPSPLNPMVPGCPCCCNNGFLPSNATGAQSVGSSNCTCVPRASVSALPACGGNATWCSYSTSAATPMTPSCSCCCVAGTTPTNATCSCA